MNEKDLNTQEVNNSAMSMQPEIQNIEIPMQPEIQNIEIPMQPEIQNIEIPMQPEVQNIEMPMQPEVQNIEIPMQPEIQTDGMSNIMNEFQQAVTPEIQNSTNINIVPPVVNFENQNVDTVSSVDQMPSNMDASLENNIENTQSGMDQMQSEANSIVQPSVGVSDGLNSVENVVNPQVEIGQVSQEITETTQKTKNNWMFIILLFAVVGAFVLLLPIIIDIFGY